MGRKKETTLNTELIWFFGPSGAGKETAINNLTSGKRKWDFLAERLGLSKNIVKSNESLRGGDHRNSDKVKEEVINLAKQKDAHILIKVQWGDIENRCVPKELRQEMPNAIHRVVMLYITPVETVKRLGNDPRPNRRVSDEEGARSHLKRMIGHVVDLQKEDFEAIWVDSDDYEYNPLSQAEVKNLIKYYGN